MMVDGFDIKRILPPHIIEKKNTLKLPIYVLKFKIAIGDVLDYALHVNTNTMDM